MKELLEQLIARGWNALTRGGGGIRNDNGLDLGLRVVDGQVTKIRITVPHGKRAEHIVTFGITGTGKSTAMRRYAEQDLEARRGLVWFENHRDGMDGLLRLFAAEECRLERDLSEKLVIVDPADSEYSVGLNVLERRSEGGSFLQIAEFAQILKQRWHLEVFGARTEELLRNSLYLLADNHLTLLELTPLLTNAAFRTICLQRCTNLEVKTFFEARYNRASENMQAVFRDAILNKVSAFTADPSFRHIVGQRQSTFSLVEAMDQGQWVLLDLDRGRLGEQAATFGSLFLTKLKNALFARRSRTLVTFYIDEVQNFVSSDSALETLLAEARKFGISVVTANQFLDQYPASVRAALLAVGTHAFFRLSSVDADRTAAALDGGRALGELLKNLPQRHFVVKCGHHRWQRGVVPQTREPAADYADLYNRCRTRWCRRRTEIEQEIRTRHQQAMRQSNEVLDGWE